MKIAIIGGSGKMGRWFAHFLRQEGYEVVITGRNQAKLREAGQQLDVSTTTDNLAAVKGARAVLISVPIESFEAVVSQIGPHTEPEQLIIDVTSIKAFPVAKMHQHIKAGVVLGGHPVFGPGAKDIAYRSFILTPTNDEETALAQKVKDYLEARGARATLMSPEEHDETMAVVLGLAHFIAIASADALLGFDRLKQLGAIGGVTFRLLLTLTESVISEDPEFYASLQMHLPKLAQVERNFNDKVRDWAELVASGDKEQFARRMSALKEKYREVTPDFGSAYEDMYRLIEVLQKPPQG
ncbi:MAG: prephenate dehydrogenase [Dehalococcoidales bacterium]|nr:prephenate dehydrogenase [Dehalococcoidales bacterium]